MSTQPEAPPQYPDKDGADLPVEDRDLEPADQTPELDAEDDDDVDLAEGIEDGGE